MKTKQELIDFYNWVWDNDLINDPRETEEIVDVYLKVLAEKRKGTKGFHDVEEFYP